MTASHVSSPQLSAANWIPPLPGISSYSLPQLVPSTSAKRKTVSDLWIHWVFINVCTPIGKHPRIEKVPLNIFSVKETLKY